jgi:hypothetical protein
LTMNADKTVNVVFTLSQSPPGDISLSLSGGESASCNSVPLSWTASSDATEYLIFKGSPEIDITPYKPYTALNFTDPDGSANSTVSPNVSYRYQIEAKNSAGTVRSNNLNITTPYCAPTVSLSADPPLQIYQGQSKTLTWSSTNTTSCVASGAWSGSRAINGGSTSVSPSSTSTYTLTCRGLDGSDVSAQVTIEIIPLGLPGWKEIIPR